MTGHETLEFAKCVGGAKEESLTGCEPEAGKITSTALLDKVGYSSASLTGPVLALLEPESGSTLASVKFVGEGCIATSTMLTGDLIGEVFSGGKVVEVGANEVEAATAEIKLPVAEKTIWTESSGSLTLVKSSLSVLESAATLEGAATLELSSKAKWAPFPRPWAQTELIYITPQFVEYHEILNEEKEFIFQDMGSDKVEYQNTKIVGGEAGDYTITDKHACTTTTWNTGGRCGLTIKLIEPLAGSALLEGEVDFLGGSKRHFRAKALVNP
jgi:hypothetical protein